MPRYLRETLRLLDFRSEEAVGQLAGRRRDSSRPACRDQTDSVHFGGGGGSGSRSLAATYPHRPHRWTTSPDSGRTGGSLRASRIASPHSGHSGAVSGSFRTSICLATDNRGGEHPPSRHKASLTLAVLRDGSMARPEPRFIMTGVERAESNAHVRWSQDDAGTRGIVRG
jgi:hypothetical protein